MQLDHFLDWAHHNLLESEDARSYMLGRGVSQEQWSRHKLGFVAGDYDVDPTIDPAHGDNCADCEKRHLWCDSCRYRQWSSAWEETDGIRKRHVGRSIVGSVVFPLTSYSGQFVGFQTRAIKVKEYNTFALSRRPEGYFFGIGPNMEAIWDSKSIWLVEGPGDQLIIERLLAKNSVALTTAGVSAAQMRFLRRFVQKIYLCLDLDETGRKATRDFIARYADYFDICSVKYPRLRPNDKDPGDLWRTSGDVSFKRHFQYM